MLSKLVAIAGTAFAVASVAAAADAFAVDDECVGGGDQCALSALQLRGAPVEDSADLADDARDVELSDAVNGTLEAQWHSFAGKMWGKEGGVESITRENVDYWDRGMNAAHRSCRSPGCALVINPPGHRTKDVSHIHMIRYQDYGMKLKNQLEALVCGSHSWGSGGLPCHGRAAFFPGWPQVFSAARTGGDISSASVIAWPQACGGSGTIVQLAFGCSIEHQIRGDYDASKR